MGRCFLGRQVKCASGASALSLVRKTSPFAGVEGAAKEFVEENKAKGEPLVKECESPPAAQSDEDRVVFSPAIEVDEPDGKGSIVRDEHVCRSKQGILSVLSHTTGHCCV